MPATIDADVLDVLARSRCEKNLLFLPEQLERKLYERTAKVMTALTGKWNRKAKAHVFEEEAAPLIGDAVATGQYVDPKKHFQFFETPAGLAEDMAGRIGGGFGESGLTVLEPSAGKGALVRACLEELREPNISCIEIQPKLAAGLFKEFDIPTIAKDFLTMPIDGSYFQRIIMNPPFTRNQDIDHVMHAWKFLAPGGTLVAITAAGWTFRQDKKALAFKQFVKENGSYESLDEGTFKESGTNVRTMLVELHRAA